jgi:hypothetical protein
MGKLTFHAREFFRGIDIERCRVNRATMVDVFPTCSSR